jgi:tight adherence protein C
VKGFVPSLGFWAMPLLFGALGFYFPRARLREKSGAVLKRIQRSFPSFLDVFALTLESGQNFQSALILAGQHLAEPSGRPGLRAQLEEVLRAIRAGKPRVDALQQMAERLGLPEVIQFVASVATSEKQGASITGLLRRQSQQLRLSRALAAERHAMKLPVKLLAPLAICIFPCTFLVLGFPIGVQLLSSGIFSS